MIVILISILGWSENYETLKIASWVILVTTNLIFVIFSRLISNQTNCVNKIFDEKIGFYIISILFFSDLLYIGDLPILKFISFPQNQVFSEINHIKTLFPIYASMSGFYILNHFNSYLILKRNGDIFKFGLLIAYLFIIQARGLLLVSIIGTFCLFIMHRKATFFRIKNIVAFGIFFASIFLIIGYLRPVKEKRFTDTDFNSIFLEIGEAKGYVKENILLRTIFPIYLYTASPLHNLSKLIENKQKVPMMETRSKPLA